MYNAFFGFKEKPFQLVPNPAYLFLSKSHEEALAHLSYAVSQGDGFVEITGEVGTGKTTLCRVFLENTDLNTEVAYIFNPMSDGLQLLKTVNHELGISSESGNRKELLDSLNTFLMEKFASGKRVILLIDEAQNLNKEVLEQLRLLSNLETNTSKLLQIILVGQPELREILDARELRQLAQRITLSCHLMPLNLKETISYVHHRIQIASQKPGEKFTNSAIKAIYKYSSGIPRLINIACDRALLTAFGLNQHKVSSSVAKAAIRELSGRSDRRSASSENKSPVLILGLSLIALIVAIFQAYQYFRVSPEATQQSVVRQQKPKSKSLKKTEPIHIAEKKPEIPMSVQNLGEFLTAYEHRSSASHALQTVCELWGGKPVAEQFIKDIQDIETYFRLGAAQNGLLLYRLEGSLQQIVNLDLPVILEIYPSMSQTPVYPLITQIKGQEITLKGGDNKTIIINANDLKGLWTGTAYVLWKNFLAISGTIPREAPQEAVITLKMLLKDMGHNIDIKPIYDDQTRKIIEDIQKKYGLKADGSVGPMTKIVLYNNMKSFNIPHILSDERGK